MIQLSIHMKLHCTQISIVSRKGQERLVHHACCDQSGGSGFYLNFAVLDFSVPTIVSGYAFMLPSSPELISINTCIVLRICSGSRSHAWMSWPRSRIPSESFVSRSDSFL